MTGAPPWDSTLLSRAIGVDPDDFDRHTALGDCQWARAMWRAVYEDELPCPAFVDIEAINLHPWHRDPWEVGLVLPDGEEHRWFLPVDLAHADPFSLEVGGYHTRHPDGYAYQPSTSGPPQAAHSPAVARNPG